MVGLRAICLRLCLGLVFAALSVSGAWAQGLSFGPVGRGGQPPIPDNSASPRTTDPQAYDAIDLFSRLCVSTRGDRAQGIGIIGEGDSAIENMDAGLLRGLENGAVGGIGWIVRMPLGDRILLEFPADGGCVVRAPRVNARQLETAFRNLLDQYAASGQFVVRNLGEQTKTVDEPARPAGPNGRPARPAEKLKYHIMAYGMTMPDSGRTAQLVLASTDSLTPMVQATISFVVAPDTAESREH